MRVLPEDVTAYKTVGPFVGAKIPNALFSRHNTMKGVWGVLEIYAGRVNYIIDETGEEFNLSAGDKHVILPQEWHFLSMPGDAKRDELELSVTFHKVIED